MAYIQVSRYELRNRLKVKWDATSALPMPFWVDAEANFAINEALQWYNLYTGVWRERVTLPTVADQVYYTLPSTLVYNVRMEFNGQPLALSSTEDLDNAKPGWEAQTTATTGAPTAPQCFAPIGMNQCVIWPADAVGSNSLLIDGVHATPTLTADADFIDLDESEVDAILGEALFISTFKDGGRIARATGWHQEFLKTVMAHNGRLNASDAFRKFAGTDYTRHARPLSAGNA